MLPMSSTQRLNLKPEFFTSSPRIMGILNITPNSFSDGGQFLQYESALQKFADLRAEGADIIDIGGESTGPGQQAISAEEELARILPIVSACSKDNLVSVDTYKSQTALQCLEAGATMINDVSALRADRELAQVIADFGCFVVLMYSKEIDDLPHATFTEREYVSVLDTVTEFLLKRVDYALACGIKPEQIILDPGMGRFISHADKYSWEILHNLEHLCASLKPFPLLVGVSRKSFLASSFLARPVEERDPLSQLIGLHAWSCGASIVRTHRPLMAKQFLNTWKLLNQGA